MQTEKKKINPKLKTENWSLSRNIKDQSCDLRTTIYDQLNTILCCFYGISGIFMVEAKTLNAIYFGVFLREVFFRNSASSGS